MRRLAREEEKGGKIIRNIMFRLRLFLVLILPVLTLDRHHTPTLCHASATRRHHHQHLRQQQQHQQPQTEHVDVQPRSRVTFTCRGEKKGDTDDKGCQQKPKFIVSWAQDIVDKFKSLGVGPQPSSKLVRKLGGVEDPFFSDQIVASCGTKCPLASAEGTNDIATGHDLGGRHKVGSARSGRCNSPITLQWGLVQSFLLKDRYSVFGMARSTTIRRLEMLAVSRLCASKPLHLRVLA